MLNVNVSDVDYLLGIFNDDHLSYNLEKTDREPDLTEMALVAMNILSRNRNGYLLLIEGMSLSPYLFSIYNSFEEQIFQQLVESIRLITKTVHVLRLTKQNSCIMQ